MKGPSLARDKRAFIHEYGTEMELLVLVNRLTDLDGSTATAEFGQGAD